MHEHQVYIVWCKRILEVDLGLNPGWAIYQPHGLGEFLHLLPCERFLAWCYTWQLPVAFLRKLSTGPEAYYLVRKKHLRKIYIGQNSVGHLLYTLLLNLHDDPKRKVLILFPLSRCGCWSTGGHNAHSSCEAALERGSLASATMDIIWILTINYQL